MFGASGLVGRKLVPQLEREGVRVTRYARGVRSATPEPNVAYWDPPSGPIDLSPLERADAVINLAGESLADGLWTKGRKRRLWSSRVQSTELLCRAIAELSHKPAVLVNASAVGYYGHRELEEVREGSQRGGGFLAELAEAWEAATQPAQAAGVRVVMLRFGVVLAPEGGALAKMLPVFRKGFGGRMGDGTQAMPWISLPDAIGVIRFAIACRELSGPVNAVAPEIVTNAQLTDSLARVLGKPARLPVPAFVLRATLGELAQETLLMSARVRPHKLEVAGYRFEYPRLEDALITLFRGSIV